VAFSVFSGLRGLALAAVVVGAAAPASAHHSFAMFDNEHQIKIYGTVAEFEWTNPHIYIAITGGPQGQEAKKWTIEGASPGILNRVGWKFNMLKPGDKVIMIVAPVRTGGPSALLKEVTLPNGKVMNNGGFAGPALIH